jgi:DNA-binding CsgD family transcriptional regulator
VLVVSPSRLLAPALAAICGGRREFRICDATTTLSEMEAACDRCRPAVVVLDFTHSMSSVETRLAQAVLGRLMTRLPVVLYLARFLGELPPLPPGTRCAVAAEDLVEEWPLALGAAVRGAFHLGPAIAARVASVAQPPWESGAVTPEKPLSPRECEVTAMARAGFRPREIALRLGRSVKTVEAHFHRVKLKLGLRSMEQLRAVAM